MFHYPIGSVPPLSVVKLLRTERAKGGRRRLGPLVVFSESNLYLPSEREDSFRDRHRSRFNFPLISDVRESGSIQMAIKKLIFALGEEKRDNSGIKEQFHISNARRGGLVEQKEEGKRRHGVFHPFLVWVGNFCSCMIIFHSNENEMLTK